MASSKKDTIASMTKQDKANCIIIRSKGTNEQCLTDVQLILPHLQPILLKNYGNERTEKAELIFEHHMSNDLRQVGKFYDHEGSSLWYYYVYGELSPSKGRTNLDKNFIATRLLQRCIYGDIAIIRSGPTTSTIDPWLSIDKLAQTVIFYETHDPATVFGERERKRCLEGLGIEDDDSILTFTSGFGFKPF